MWNNCDAAFFENAQWLLFPLIKARKGEGGENYMFTLLTIYYFRVIDLKRFLNVLNSLILCVLTPKNGQTHSNNSSANSDCRGVFRTRSSIEDGTFSENSSWLSFSQKASSFLFEGVLNMPLNSIYNIIWNELVFVRNRTFKGTQMQVWKSASIFVLIWK